VNYPDDQGVLLILQTLFYSNRNKLSCCCDSRSYTAYARRMVYWQTIKSVAVTSLWTAGTHNPIQRYHWT